MVFFRKKFWAFLPVGVNILFYVVHFFKLLNFFAGLPATTVFDATLFVTMLPAPTNDFSPTVIPGIIIAPVPITQPFLKIVG